MSSKSYSTTSTRVSNMPKTLGAQDSGVVAEGGSNVNITVLDDKSMENAMILANKTFEKATETTGKALGLAGIYSSNESKNLRASLDATEYLARDFSDKSARNLSASLNMAGNLAKDFSDKSAKNLSASLNMTGKLAKDLSDKSALNLQRTIDLGKLTYLRSADLAESSMGTQAETLDNAMRFMKEANIEKRENIEGNRQLYERLLPQETQQKQNFLFYSSLIGGAVFLFTLYKK